MSIPIVSIIMPVYNAEEYIHRSIDSILNQNHLYFELIIINYGSTDHTQAIIESYKDKRINLVNNNYNFIDSLNLGIVLAQGKYITQMDVDHIMLSDRIEKQYNFLENNPNIDLCGGAIKLLGHLEQESYTFTNPLLIKLNMLHTNQFNRSTVMMKTSLRELFPIENNIFQMYKKGYDGAEDYKMLIDLITKNCNITNMTDILVDYQISESQVTRNSQLKMIQSSLRVQSEYIENLMKEMVEINDTLFDFFNLLIDNFNKKEIDIKNLRNVIYTIYQEHLILGLRLQ